MGKGSILGQSNPAVHPHVKPKATFLFQSGLTRPSSCRTLCVPGFLEPPERGLGHQGVPSASSQHDGCAAETQVVAGTLFGPESGQNWGLFWREGHGFRAGS